MTLAEIVTQLLPYILSAVVAMQVWFLKQIMAIDNKLTRLEEHKSDASETKLAVSRNTSQTALHEARIHTIEVKLDLILKKIESLEQNCLLHRLLQRANPERLLEILQSARENNE